MTSNKRPRRNLFALALLLCACDPEAKNLGEDLGDWAVDWRVESSLEGSFYDIEPTADGGVIALEADSNLDPAFLRRYAADGSLQWTAGARFVAIGGQIAATESAIFLSGDAAVNSDASRAKIQRFSAAGVVERTYTQPRAGSSNSFSFGLAASDDEIAVSIGNWGSRSYPGEPQYEVQRLDHDLVPIGEPLPFDARVEDLAYDASGELVILEAPDEGLATVHRPMGGGEAVLVDCELLLTPGGLPLCANSGPDFRLTNYETGAVQDIGWLEFAEFSVSNSAKPTSTVFADAFPDNALVDIVEVLSDGTVGRAASLPLGESSLGADVSSVRQTASGAAYVVVTEHLDPEVCSDTMFCYRDHLVRLASE